MLETLIALGFISMATLLVLIITLATYILAVCIYPPIDDYINGKIEEVVTTIKRLFNR